MKRGNVQRLLGLCMAVVMAVGEPSVAVLAEDDTEMVIQSVQEEMSLSPETVEVPEEEPLEEEEEIQEDQDILMEDPEQYLSGGDGEPAESGAETEEEQILSQEEESEEAVPLADLQESTYTPAQIAAAEKYLEENYVNGRIVTQDDDCVRKRIDGSYEVGTHDRIGVAVQEMIFQKEPAASRYKICWFVNHTDVIKRYGDTSGSNYPYVDYIDRYAPSGDTPHTNRFQLNYYRKEDCDVPYMAFFPEKTHTFTVTARLYPKNVKDSEMLDGTAQPLASHDFTFYHLSWKPGMTRFRVNVSVYRDDTGAYLSEATSQATVWQDGQRVLPFVGKTDGKLHYNLLTGAEYEIRVPAMTGYAAVSQKITFSQGDVSVNMIPDSYETTILCQDALDSQTISGAAVVLKDAAGKSIARDMNGRYQLKRNATYYYTASAANYTSVTGSFTIPVYEGTVIIKMGSKDAITVAEVRDRLKSTDLKEPLKVIWGKDTSVIDVVQRIVDGYTDINGEKAVKVRPTRSFDPSVIENSGRILYRKSEDPKDGADPGTVDYTFEIACGKEVTYLRQKILAGWNMDWLQEKVTEDVASLNWEQIKGENTVQPVTVSDLLLPDAGKWTSLAWTSDHPEIIGIREQDGTFTGQVARPLKNTNVTLTATGTIREQTGNASLDDLTGLSPAKQEITVLVAGTEEGELEAAIREATGEPEKPDPGENPDPGEKPDPGDQPAEPEVPVHVHQFGAWSTVEEATVTAPARQQRLCPCGQTETRTIGDALPAYIRTNVKTVTLKKGQSTGGLTVSMARGDAIRSWKSANPKVASVSSKGVIRAGKKTGKTTITITLNSGRQAVVQVKVQKGTVRTTKLTGLPSRITMKKGSTQYLKPVRVPFTSGEKITCQTSSKKVAAVSKTGKITAKKKGKAVITVRSGKKKVKIKVTVK